MIEKREGKEARLKELNMHLQVAYRFWQRRKMQTFHAELGSATAIVNNHLANSTESGTIMNHIQAAKSAAEQNDEGQVTYQLSKAIALSERILRLGK